jgi:hypothetical protein
LFGAGPFLETQAGDGAVGEEAWFFGVFLDAGCQLARILKSGFKWTCARLGVHLLGAGIVGFLEELVALFLEFERHLG